MTAQPVLACMELCLEPAHVPALLALPVFTARECPAPARFVWHDTSGSQLLQAGLSLMEADGEWRLERLHPDDSIWLPATPPPLVQSASSIDDIKNIHGALAPVAAWIGQLHCLEFDLGAESGAASLLEGRLRGVTQEQPACRLLLSGPPPAISRLLRTLPHGRVPRASLGAQAMALARTQPPAPRRLGAPALPPDAGIADGFAHLAGHLLDTMLHWADRVIDAVDPGALGPEPVHQLRVAVRRFRSLLSVFKRALNPDAVVAVLVPLKELSQKLGAARDWDVFLTGTGERLQQDFPDDPRIAALLAAGAQKREQFYGALWAYLAKADFHRLELALADFVVLRPWIGEAEAEALAGDIERFVAKAMKRQYRHVLSPGDHLPDLPADQQHDIRKKAKRLRYAGEFFRLLYPAKAVKRLMGRANALQDILGEVNDAHTVGALMAQLHGAGQGFAAGAAQGYAAHIADRAREHVVERWNRFRAVEPFWS